MKHGVNTKIVNWLTVVAFVISLVNWVLVVKSTGVSGDAGIALWAGFMFSFVLVSMPLHGLLVLLVVVQFFIGSLKPIRWLCIYLLVSALGHSIVAYRYGAFDQHIQDAATPSKSPAKLLIEKAFSTGKQIDIAQLKLALSQGANANDGFYQGKIPYVVQAASKADAKALKVLLEGGADPNIRSQIEFSPVYKVSIEGAKALDVVAFSSYGDIKQSTQILLDAGANPRGTLLALGACRKGDMALYQWVNELGANQSIPTLVTDAHFKTCLHHAAEKNRAAFIDALFSAENADKAGLTQQLSAITKNKQSPLDLAISSKSYAAAIALVNAGGKANQTWTLQRVLDNPTPTAQMQKLAEVIRAKGIGQ